jgi:hypothetical protein
MNRAHLARFAALVALAAAAVSCRSTNAPAGVTRDMAAAIPADTWLLAGLDLASLRAAPLYPQLPPAARALAEQFRDAAYLLLASNGKDIAVITPSLAAAGRKTGRGGAPDLLLRAASLADGKQIWVVARGGVPLPVAGNAANLNRLLRNTEYAAITARIGSRIEIEATAAGRTAEAAREFEESLRAILSLTAAGNARQPDLVALIRSIRIGREDRTVRANLSAGPDAAAGVLRLVP